MVCVYMCIYICIFMCTEPERERESERKRCLVFLMFLCKRPSEGVVDIEALIITYAILGTPD